MTLHLAGTRDLGAATLSERGSAKAHLALVGSPTGLAVRLIRPVALGWLFAVAAFAVLIGTTAESATKDATGIARDLAGHRTARRARLDSVADYLGLTFLMLALLIALVAAGQITAIRTEEADGQLENLLVRPLNRISWFAGRLGLSTLLVIVAGIVAGVGTWVGAASQHSGVRFGSLVTAGVNVVPPGLFLLGLGALVHRGMAATNLDGCVWIPGLGVSGRVRRRSNPHQSLAVGYVRLLPHGARSRHQPRLVERGGHGRARTGLGAALGGLLLARRDVENA